MRLHGFALASCLAIALGSPVAAAGQDEVIARIGDTTPIDAFRGRVVWSEPSSSSYRLVEYRNGKVGRLPVAPARTPFDVDLGTDRGGALVAVYARCGETAPEPAPDTDGRLGCDLYRYDFRHLQEMPIRRANTRADEQHPSIWNGRLAFTRTYRPKSSGGGKRRAYWRNGRARGPSVRLGRAPRGTVPSDIELGGTWAAIYWGRRNGGGLVRVVRLRSGTPVAATVSAEYASAVFGLSITSGFVYWGVSIPPDCSCGAVEEVRRYDLETQTEERSNPMPYPVEGFAQDDAASYLTEPLPNLTYALHRAAGIPFVRTARALTAEALASLHGAAMDATLPRLRTPAGHLRVPSRVPGATVGSWRF
jgi:hypothetical protein